MAKQALIIIDLQNDYFPGGKWPLYQIENVAENARRVLDTARSNGELIVHVHHEFLMENPPFFAPDTDGSKIHEMVSPLDGEVTVLKNQVNAFKDTNLKAILDENQVTDLTIVGAMSHMCVDAATRAAADFGYAVTVIEDACASRDLEFNDTVINAEKVHAAYMSSLAFGYSEVTTTAAYLDE